MFTFTNCIKVLVSTISIFIFMVGAFVYAGTTGKISGKIIDKTTREALIGTNVLVVGTSIGASSDLDGNYFIINLPPGEYQLKASMVGYASFVVQKVRVSVDQTTKIDFELNPESMELADVIVTAEKHLVRKDLTSTEQTISSENISMLPLEDVSAVVNLQAGVVDGHFRGGRGN